MKRKRLAELADVIENREIRNLGFNMSDFFSRGTKKDRGGSCQTVGCIAGWAVAKYGGISTSEMLNVSYPIDFFTAAGSNILGLTREQADQLFLGYVPTGNNNLVNPSYWLFQVKPGTAVEVLRHASKTGRIDWYRAIEKCQPELMEQIKSYRS